MTLRDAAIKIGVRADTLRRQIARGKLTATKRGRDWHVTTVEVRRYRNENARPHAAKAAHHGVRNERA